MPRPNSKNALRTLALSALFSTPLAAAAADNGELWEVTMKMEMTGMPMQMPAQTNKVCKPKDQPQEQTAVPEDKNCKMTDVKRSGTKSSFTIVCTGKDAYTGKGEFDHQGDRYTGKIQIAGDIDGESMNMTQNISGRRVGTCTYEDPEKKAKEMIAKSEAEVAKACRAEIKKLNWVIFREDLAGASCQPYKKEFCSHVGSSVSKDMRTASGFTKVADKDSSWENMFQLCGLDSKGLQHDACQDGVQRKNWDFVGRFCPVEGKAIAQEQCVGRDYTAVMSGPYAALCRQHAADAVRRDARETQPADAVKEGVKSSLKKLLPF